MPPNTTAPRPTPAPSRASSAPQSSKAAPSAGGAKSSTAKALLLILVLILLAAGYYAGTVMGSRAGYTQGKTDATKELTAKIVASNAFPKEAAMLALSGTVTAVSADGLELQVTQTVRNPLEDPAPLTRTVTVTAKTKISRMTRKADDVFKSEMDAFQLATKKFDPANPQSVIPMPPQPFDQKDIALSDISKGMQVTVTAVSDITTAASFTASTVVAQEISNPVTAPDAQANPQPPSANGTGQFIPPTAPPAPPQLPTAPPLAP